MANDKQNKTAAKQAKTTKATPSENKAEQKKKLHTISEAWLSVCIDKANELGVTGQEFQGIYPIQNGFVLVYYR